ncbi:MAG TPA: F0F1 ATP synthase subunit delta [Sedimenticola thiotaurini]|uniref:ATP synthase subunit delta n=1 Tax=Sedimenticola thiotaurini TaxID=1543721 RepID=A0A831WC12_9GAMM|nr:F0F1 ATP synthase subunit delta [Sedimenticola thiotaurini]
MAGDAITIARPYAEAIFARAGETGTLDGWSEQLAFLAGVVTDPAMAAAIADPLFDREQLARLLLEVGEGRLDQEGGNLVKVLLENGRLPILPEIRDLYEALKADSLRLLKVHVRSAYELDAAQKQQIADALKARLGRDIVISSEQDPELIGGIHIRAGDMVIDGSVRGQLQQLANELGI